MKKLKVLRGALIGVFVVAAACCIFTACSSDKDSADNTPITEMTLSIDNVKRTYLTYQSFSTDGLEATVKRESGNEESVSASYLDVDYSAFDNTKAGEYDIVVSYTEYYTEDDGIPTQVTLTQSYGVEVIEEISGMKVEKTTVDYAIESGAGAEIKLDDIKVYSVTGENEDSRELSSGEYELKYFKGGEEITSLSGLSAGVYTIYAYREVEISGKYSNISYECGAYVLVYVSDSLVSLTFNEEGAVVTQDLSSEDKMTGTWTFTLTYESGIEKILSIDDVVVTNLNTGRPAPSGETATVSYTEKYYVSDDAEREDKSVTTEVEYTITVPEGGVTLEYEFDFDALINAAGYQEYAEVVDKTILDGSFFTGNNAFLAYSTTDASSNDNSIRTSSNGSISIKAGTLAVTFYGTGSLEISAFSTGSSNKSTLALRNEKGTFIQGTMEEDPNLKEYTDDSGNYIYEVYGSAPKTVTYNIVTPGTYTICANQGNSSYSCTDETSEGLNSPGRATILKTIKMVDNISDTESTGMPIVLIAPSLENLSLSVPGKTRYTCGKMKTVRV